MSDEISKFLSERIAANDFPSAVYLVAEKGEIVLHEALGHAVVEPELITARKDTVYDLASLTKVLVTGLLTAKLIEEGKIQLDARVSLYLKEFDIDGKRMITLADLLSHTSRLPAWKPFYLMVESAEEVIGEIGRTQLNYEQESVKYSDLNFIALGCLIEAIRMEPLAVVYAENVTNPLGIESPDMAFNPLKDSLITKIAASEKGNEFERSMCIDLGFLDAEDIRHSTHFRSDQILGEVHDGNAYFMGGVAGHAGLFSNAEEVFKIALQFLPNYTTLLKPETCELFRTNLTPEMNEHRSHAFQLATTLESTAGTKMSSESFGHLGFTGTSLWVDPVKERIFILLTNRTHNHDRPFVNLNSTRRQFHDLAIDFLDKK